MTCCRSTKKRHENSKHVGGWTNELLQQRHGFRLRGHLNLAPAENPRGKVGASKFLGTKKTLFWESKESQCFPPKKRSLWIICNLFLTTIWPNNFNMHQLTQKKTSGMILDGDERRRPANFLHATYIHGIEKTLQKRIEKKTGSATPTGIFLIVFPQQRWSVLSKMFVHPSSPSQ